MIYIDLINNKEELLKEKEKKYNKFLKKIIIYYRMWTSYIAISQKEFGEIITIQKFNNVTYEKFKKLLKIKSVKTICLSNKFNNNDRIYVESYDKHQEYTQIIYKDENLNTIKGYIKTDYIEMDKLDNTKIILIIIIIRIGENCNP